MNGLSRKALMIMGVALLALSMTGCADLFNSLADWLSAPYGYVYDSSNAAIVGATVTVYSGASVAAGTLVQSAVTTGATGYFTLANKVDSKGGTYTVRVTATGYVFDDTVIIVPASTYLFNIGTIKPSSSLYSVSGKVVNVRVETQTGNLPTAGNIEVRKFGDTTATKTAAIASDGTYTVSGIASGSYFVTFKDSATTATWTGIPVSVEIAGGNITNLGALVYQGVTSSSSILLVLTWTNTAYDVDSHAMVGAIGSAVEVSYATPTLNSGSNVVTLERDITASKITNGAYPAETMLVTSLAASTELRFYAYGYTAGSSISGLDSGASSVKPAGVKLYAMCGGEHFGTWTAPLNSDERTVGIVQITGNGTTMTIGTLGGNIIKSLQPIFGSGFPVSVVE